MRTAVFMCLSLIASAGHTADWTLLPDQTHHLQLSQEDQSLVIQTTGHDPFLVGRWRTLPQVDDQVLEFEYFSTTGVKDFSVITGPPISEKGRIQLPPLMIAEGWQTYRANLAAISGQAPQRLSTLLRFDLGSKPNVRIRIRNIHVRPQTPTEIAAQKVAQQRREQKRGDAKAIVDYLRSSHADLIENVSVQDDQVLLTIKATDGAQGEDRVLEYPPHRSATDDGIEVEFRKTKVDGKTVISVPRHDGDYDRLTSSWRLERNGKTTARRYADQISPTTKDFSAERHAPRNQKGLSGLSRRGPRSDFPELGITSVTVNVSLTQFLSSTPGENRTRIPAPGMPIYFKPDAFAYYDQSMDFAREHDIVVSAIVLIPAPKRRASVLVHPETDGGTYAMPDLTTRRGVAVYTYILNQIARRYRSHERSPGGITNWIAHNEIDFHTVWTNMGRQPRPLVMETYYRSMRLIDLISRQYNPHARVFASLTHHFNVPDDGRWQRLSPRELLQTLQRYSKVEGDFDWGVAYHPYPQSLFARVAWEDKKVSDDFDTPLITIQNLQVLGRFLQQPSMLTPDKRVRGVLLSEQGFHTRSYESEAQDFQAASLWWTMKRVRQMPWIESFIYHRWIDHPAEGGLKLGLRTLPSTEHPGGQKKRSWDVYQAIGTKAESTVAKGLPVPPKAE